MAMGMERKGRGRVAPVVALALVVAACGGTSAQQVPVAEPGVETEDDGLLEIGGTDPAEEPQPPRTEPPYVYTGGEAELTLDGQRVEETLHLVRFASFDEEGGMKLAYRATSSSAPDWAEPECPAHDSTTCVTIEMFPTGTGEVEGPEVNIRLLGFRTIQMFEGCTLTLDRAAAEGLEGMAECSDEWGGDTMEADATIHFTGTPPPEGSFVYGTGRADVTFTGALPGGEDASLEGNLELSAGVVEPPGGIVHLVYGPGRNFESVYRPETDEGPEMDSVRLHQAHFPDNHLTLFGPAMDGTAAISEALSMAAHGFDLPLLSDPAGRPGLPELDCTITVHEFSPHGGMGSVVCTGEWGGGFMEADGDQDQISLPLWQGLRVTFTASP